MVYDEACACDEDHYGHLFPFALVDNDEAECKEWHEDESEVGVHLVFASYG